MTTEKLYSEGYTIVPLSQYTDVIMSFDTIFSVVKTCVFNFHVHCDTSVTTAVYFYQHNNFSHQPHKLTFQKSLLRFLIKIKIIRIKIKNCHQPTALKILCCCLHKYFSSTDQNNYPTVPETGTTCHSEIPLKPFLEVSLNTRQPSSLQAHIWGVILNHYLNKPMVTRA